MPEFDVVVVGSGPGGATAADVLTAAGKSVCVLEKGRNHLLALVPPFDGLGHLSNDEVKFARRHFLGPDPLLEPRTYRRSTADGERLATRDLNNMPSTVGGAGFHADGKLPRYREVDFRLASELGPVEGAEVADWPLDYDELEPFYAEAERVDRRGRRPHRQPVRRVAQRSVSDATGRRHVPHDPDRARGRDARIPPVPCARPAPTACPTTVGPRATTAGSAPSTVARSTPRATRSPCCAARSGAGAVSCAPRASRSRSCSTASGARSTGVRYLDGDGVEHTVSADAVVVACGAFETPRLLLRSGIGNSSDLVGRFLMFHLQTIVLGFFPFRLHAHKGRDVTHLMDDPIVGDAESAAAARAAGVPYLRGGIVEHGGNGHPILEALFLPPGPDHTALMLDSTTRDKMVAFTMQGEDLPQFTNRVDLDGGVRDVWGLPAGRVTYAPHAHEVACVYHWGPRLETVLRAAGAQGTSWVTSPGTPGTIAPDIEPMSKHWMGTARMGTDPGTSVCDPWQRLWDVDNVVVTDSSVFPTSTGYGPTLTLVALALRAAGALAASL